MIKVKTTVTYRVPDWNYCNCSRMGRVTKETCRFCTKVGKQYVCTLHNIPLSVSDGIRIEKTEECRRACAGFRSEVADEPPVKVNPKDLMKATLTEYRKVYKQLIAEGYPEALADKFAQKALLED